jgi:hypothetical protein
MNSGSPALRHGAGFGHRGTSLLGKCKPVQSRLIAIAWSVIDRCIAALIIPSIEYRSIQPLVRAATDRAWQLLCEVCLLD